MDGGHDSEVKLKRSSYMENKEDWVYHLNKSLYGSPRQWYLSCQEWDSNPCPFGPVPETGALDQLGHLDIYVCFA
ncbi:hypothetical protein CR513_59794, partial [Mucuna pruriens]